MPVDSPASLEAMLLRSNPLWSSLASDAANDARVGVEAVLHAAGGDPLEYAHFVCEDAASGSFTVLAFTSLHLIVVTRAARGGGAAGMTAVVRAREGLRALIFSRAADEEGVTATAAGWRAGTVTLDYGNAELYSLAEAENEALTEFLPSLKHDLGRA